MRLRTSRPDRPGYSRVRHGRGFRYLDPSGAPVKDPAQKARLRALVIPPAWADVWICPWPGGHIQAMGTDAAGRRQYLYHQRFRERQEAAKHEHVLDVARRLPRLREGIRADLDARGLTRDRVLACTARLLDLGFFRVGGAAYRKDHEAYGLTTLLPEHASCRRGEVCFTYPGKSGQEQTRALVDPAAYTVVRALLRRDGSRSQLFAYRNGHVWHDVTAADVNEYLRTRSGADITAKDFRTWHATVLAAVALAVSAEAAAGSRAQRAKAESRAVREVSGYLGNTPAVCRASYIHPRLFELFEDGVTIRPALDRLGIGVDYGHPATHGEVEAAVLRLLRGQDPGGPRGGRRRRPPR
ncbi:DNA topoisomerase IB [Streptomyces sp. RerS4]|uniref:DNA topoisomerase IB n=1 Tax=Streptomyces sp. RerS4 TaxID=2942449 RepID=UPI00201BD402|nr:DNA topoisomerase IB [Streptomyces sp. RerS4]UQX03790.1 DNA topoisomerase IB [Streptomyces sp. RerS4]